MSPPMEVLPLSQHLKRLPTAMCRHVREFAAAAPAKAFFTLGAHRRLEVAAHPLKESAHDELHHFRIQRAARSAMTPMEIDDKDCQPIKRG
ncbi:MAG: hypothetical protein D6820_02560 [Lentisphaerae bacterium]|nr:MAG: hypothetical protein D6820_02560 [Lentisphaerota bacterium]